MAIDTSDFRNGMTIVLDGEVYQIIEFQHVKPGKGGAFVRSKLRHFRTGKVIEKTFRAGEKMDQAILERRKVQYLYSADAMHSFMDMETFEQFDLPEEAVGEPARFLIDQLEVTLTYWGDTLLTVELPNTVEAEVIQTDPGVRGDTASGGSKPAVIASGATVTVPLFINIGDVIRVDTRSGEYLERVRSS